jgi:hypothetical protein
MAAGTLLVVLDPSGTYRYRVFPAGLTRICLPSLVFRTRRTVTTVFALATVDVGEAAVDDVEVSVVPLVVVVDADEGFDELPHAARDTAAAAVMSIEMA